jgi:hypothetical protein
MSSLRSPRAFRQHGAIPVPKRYRAGPQKENLAKGARWLALLAAIALGSVGTGWLLADGHAKLVEAAIVIAALLALAVWAPGPLLALLLLAVLNGVPVVNLSGRLPGGAHFQDAAVIALMAVLYAYRGPLEGPERSRLSRVATIWGACFVGYWVLTLARSVLVDHTPLLKAILYGRDFLYFAILLPLALRARLPSRSLRVGAMMLLTALIVFAIGDTAISLTGLRLPWIVHPDLVDTTLGLTRVYSSMAYLVSTCLIFAVTLLFSKYSRGHRWLLGGLVALLLIASAVGLTRATYVGLAFALLASVSVYIIRYGSLVSVVKRGLVTILLLTAAVIGFTGNVGSSSGTAASGYGSGTSGAGTISAAAAVVSRATSTVSALTQSTGNVGYREKVDSVMLHVLGTAWPIGLGFLSPAAHYVAALPSGSIRNSDTGVFNALMTVGLIGGILIYMPLLYGLRELFRTGRSGLIPRWLIYGGASWIVWAVVGSPTLVLLFSIPGLVVTAFALAVLWQATQLQPRAFDVDARAAGGP